MKVCTKCNKKKLSSEFGSNISKHDSLQSWCRICTTEYKKQWYKDNSEEAKRRIKLKKEEYRKNNAQFLISYFLKHPCVDCGETDPLVLEFDHRDPKEKTSTVSQLLKDYPASSGQSFSKVVQEIEKCDVRCANCHRKRTARQMNWLMVAILDGLEDEADESPVFQTGN